MKFLSKILKDLWVQKSNQAKKGDSSNTYNILIDKNEKDKGNHGINKELTQYIINPEKLDNLISSIDKYSSKMDGVITQMKRTNDIQEKTLELLTKLLNKDNVPLENKEEKKKL